MAGSRAAAEAVEEMARFVHNLAWQRMPTRVVDRLRLVLFDQVSAALVGATTRTPEQQTWLSTPGTVPLWGTGRFVDLFSASFLNAQAMACQELDEGNKYAKGHPAVHGFPAVLSLASALDATGSRTAEALLACYEVSSRFGRATRLRAGAHPHGSWGVAGAAAGCAKLFGLDAPRIAAAIDTGSGMPIAGHFSSALDGNPVRDAWVGAANTSGLVAAQMAVAGTARNTGTAAHSLGDLLGVFDPTELISGLGHHFDIEYNYFKRHASCSYTHPVADVVLPLRAELFAGTPPDTIARRIESIRVETHGLASPLNRTTWHNPMSAMFSIPFVAALGLTEGEIAPRWTGCAPEEIPHVAELAKKIHVAEDPELTALLPEQRGARVIIHTSAGEVIRRQTTNPIGDSEHHPLDHTALRAVFTSLLGAEAPALTTVEHVVRHVPSAPRAQPLLRMLADPLEHGRYLVEDEQ